MDQIPTEIFFDILAFLSKKDLILLQRVSHFWNDCSKTIIAMNKWPMEKIDVIMDEINRGKIYPSLDDSIARKVLWRLMENKSSALLYYRSLPNIEKYYPIYASILLIKTDPNVCKYLMFFSDYLGKLVFNLPDDIKYIIPVEISTVFSEALHVGEEGVITNIFANIHHDRILAKTLSEYQEIHSQLSIES